MPLVDRGTRAVFVRGRYRVNKRSMHASSYSRLFVQMLSARLNNTLKTKGTKVDTARLNFTERLLPADWIPPKPSLTQINQSGNHVTSGNVSVLLFVKYHLCVVITVIIIWTPTHPPTHPHRDTKNMYNRNKNPTTLPLGLHSLIVNSSESIFERITAAGVSNRTLATPQQLQASFRGLSAWWSALFTTLWCRTENGAETRQGCYALMK